MGISGKPEQLIDLQKVRQDSIPVIKRFSGGGTVIVDEETLFITFIFQKETLPIAPFPEPILRWTADLYKQSWQIPHFDLRENDYVIGEKKCGGNAQYIKKERWLHHTSFLWNYQKKNMDYLLLPAKRPTYRQERSHEAFLTPLHPHAKSPDDLIQSLKAQLVKQFYIEEFDRSSWREKPHRQATEVLTL